MVATVVAACKGYSLRQLDTIADQEGGGSPPGAAACKGWSGEGGGGGVGGFQEYCSSTSFVKMPGRAGQRRVE